MPRDELTIDALGNVAFRDGTSLEDDSGPMYEWADGRTDSVPRACPHDRMRLMECFFHPHLEDRDIWDGLERSDFPALDAFLSLADDDGRLLQSVDAPALIDDLTRLPEHQRSLYSIRRSRELAALCWATGNPVVRYHDQHSLGFSLHLRPEGWR